MVSFTAGFICAIFLGGSLIGTDGAITGISQVVESGVVTTSALAGSADDSKATTLTLAENFAAVTTITTLTIAGATGTLTWAITTTGNVGLLTVNAGVVALAATKAFDFETSPVVTSVITAADSAATPLTATVTLTLILTNVDDNDPVFIPASYAVTIAKDSAAGKELVTVTATDADVGDVVAYTISTGNTNSDWTIGDANGKIKAAKKIEEATYTLVVIATSGSPAKTGSATVAVTVNSGAVFGVSLMALFGIILMQLV